MIDVLNLALPYFGLIFIGFACGKLKQIPDTALAWMNFFIVYVLDSFASPGATVPESESDAALAFRDLANHLVFAVFEHLELPRAWTFDG